MMLGRKSNELADAVLQAKRAEEAVAIATARLEHAREALDGELARHGWNRLLGAFDPGAAAIYTSKLYPSAALNLGDVLEHLQATNGRHAA